MVTSDFSPEVEIRLFRAYAMHPAIIMGTVRSLTWLWGRYHVPQNVFLVITQIIIAIIITVIIIRLDTGRASVLRLSSLTES